MILLIVPLSKAWADSARWAANDARRARSKTKDVPTLHRWAAENIGGQTLSISHHPGKTVTTITHPIYGNLELETNQEGHIARPTADNQDLPKVVGFSKESVNLALDTFRRNLVDYKG